MEPTTQKNYSSQKNLLIKLGFIALFILLLLIPVAMIQGLISEREELQRNVEYEVATSWGRNQTLQGPVLCIPFEKKSVYEGKNIVERRLLYLAPETLEIESGIATEVRSKGIFNTVVYEGQNRIKGAFNLSIIPKDAAITYFLNETKLIAGISDPTTVTGKIQILWNGSEQNAIPGTQNSSFTKSGFHHAAPIAAGQTTADFDLQFSIRGTTALSFLPSGRNTTIKVQSSWPSPSFTGRNLPAHRSITETGFSADWTANEYNRPFPSFWMNEEYTVSEQSEFGVQLIQTANFYQKNMRAAKYAVLVIALSFLTFFFFEMYLKVRIHPIQYLLIGLSLALFYSLLLSLTEHLGFNKAYGISFAAVVLLIAIYTKSLFEGWRPTLLLIALFTLLYGYIFVLLQLEDFALLAGSIGLFLILSTVMLLSRRINWYSYGG